MAQSAHHSQKSQESVALVSVRLANSLGRLINSRVVPQRLEFFEMAPSHVKSCSITAQKMQAYGVMMSQRATDRPLRGDTNPRKR